jgi:sirohydrochlorin ferrochelatase
MKAILLIDHGSKRAEANVMLECMANLVQAMAGPEVVVRAAHMELAEPDIPMGLAACVEAGATEVIAFPYMLSPGRHSTSDIPNLVAQAAAGFPGVTTRMTDAFGVHEKLGELILTRAGIAPVRTLASDDDAACCWDPAQSGAHGTPRCGAACRARQQSAALGSENAVAAR